MTSLEERFGMINTCSDERAAGVISGSDPYRELELYLEKVNEEIGEVFDKWGANSRVQEPVKWKSKEEPTPSLPPPPVLNEYHSKKYPPENDNFGQDLNLFKSYSLPIRRESRNYEKYLDAWSKSLLAEFNTIIQDDHDISSDNAESADDDYDEVAADSSDEDCTLMRMKYTINKHHDDYRASPTVSPSTSEHSSESSGNGNRRTPPYISRMIKNKQRSQIASIHNKHDPVLVNVKIYPTEQARLPQLRGSDYAFHNGHHHAYSPYECCINQLESRSKQQVTETGTQTSPAESRSSSFTWISDCSEDDHSSTTSSTEDSRRLGDSSGDSTPVKDEPESGIGTASPPRHCRYNKPSGVQKYRRKEVWEKLRKRQNNPKINLSNNNVSPGESHVRRSSFRNPSISVESSSDPDLTVFRTERPTCLPFASSLSPESSRETLPSPSATSLKLHMEPSELAHELSGKSSSAPLLLKHAGSASSAVPSAKKKMKQSRFHSEKLLVEIEATEACKWLRAAGFPQYAQMYEDMQFPIDVNSVQKDHQFLEPDALQSLFRRLQALNKCANMKVEFMPTNKEDESDSDTECALSENWLFQPESRRWSRICDVHHITLPTSTTDESNDNVTVVLRNSSLPPFAMQQPEGDITVSRFRRSGSERLRDGAKAFLRRVESLKSKRRKQKNREGVIISGPQVVDVSSMEAKIKELNCVDVTPPESPFTPDETHKPVRRYLSKPESDFAAFSDSEITVRQSFHDNGNNNSPKMLLDVSDVSSKQSQCSSRSGSQDSQTFALVSPIRKKNESPDAFAITEGGDTTLRQKATVARWHSFQRNSVRPSSLRGQSINSLTVGQILVLRKLSLLKLTAIMERYCPSHRTTGWNWELPKFIRKAKTPDYKDKSVFGVPLLANVQQNGNVLPEFIIEALEWLRMNALEQVGIFRKSGGRSRIHKLKMMAESRSAKMNFDNQQPHDVADMVKQYFRELPDALLTNKLSETFVAIFQYIPENLRTEAVQCALILLPDEHREALLILLDFLYLVSQHSYANQMSASNLAICLAPSLFYWTHTSNNSHIRRSSSMSPKRLQKSNAFPDVKELGQNIAAHECLYFLIENHQDLFMVTEEIMGQCHFSYMDESVPVSLEELGEELQQDWRGYLNMCRNALAKEIKEKNRGWVISTTWEDVEIAYKKVRDGHPLRLWRVCTEVEAPPKELLFRVLRERHVWDINLLRSKIVQKLEPCAELFQYVTKTIDPLPPKDFCVVRSWKTDLSKGGCMIVETSVEHSDAELIPGGVRGIVLASRYLIEPCGSGKSRILHLSRVDIKGRSSEWYNKCYGHMCAQYLLKIRNSFQRMTEGPESKV